jgi:hypothetical protein
VALYFSLSFGLVACMQSCSSKPPFRLFGDLFTFCFLALCWSWMCQIHASFLLVAYPAVLFLLLLIFVVVFISPSARTWLQRKNYSRILILLQTITYHRNSVLHRAAPYETSIGPISTVTATKKHPFHDTNPILHTFTPPKHSSFHQIHTTRKLHTNLRIYYTPEARKCTR